MEKKEVLKKLQYITDEIESILDDESFRTAAKKLDKLNTEFGALIQELEEESEDD